jgi:hexosaminidase
MLSALLLSTQAAQAPQPALVPLPQKVAWQSGAFTLGRETKVTNEGAKPETLQRLREVLGQPLPVGKDGSVHLKKVTGLPPEAYQLDVTPSRVEIRASGDAGLFYGIQTLRQLDQKGKIPACRIEDAPRFGWRGLMLDTSRHFFEPAYVRKFIDRLASYKLNSFHWHLTDDGGWRMESKRFPKLTGVGAWRKEQGVEWDYGNLWFPGRDSKEKLYGGFYTQKDIQAMIRYAAERNVNIVPEIEMPGHSAAAAAAYPELQCNAPNKPQHLRDTRSQAPMMICPGKDATIEFCKGILDETIALFPSKFIHIGADEVDKTLWKQCPDCQARMKANNLKDEHELQSWFVRQMDAHIAAKGRRLIGWDEILEGGLAKGATVMSWRGIQGGIAAAKAGQSVVMSPTSHCYFDYSYDTIPTSHVYAFDPIPKELVGAERAHVLGGQGNVWTEWLSTPEEVDSMAYPRALALAETLWTQPERKSWPDFERRLNAHYPRMDAMGIAFRLAAPSMQPSVLNLAAAEHWVIPAPTLPGARLFFNDLEVEEGGRIVLPAGEYKLVQRLPSGREGEPTVVRAVNLQPTNASQTGYRRRQIPWKGKLTPALSAFANASPQSLDSLSLQNTPTDNPFALLFEFDLKIERSGTHTFTLGSDDGSVLYLNGQRILENDGPHGYIERQATLNLLPGTYRAQITFFDEGGAKRLEFQTK